MGVVFAFVVGYVLGARAGAKEFDDIIQSVKTLRESEEFADLLGALRSHAAHAFREVAGIMEGEIEAPTLSPQDVVDRVRNLVGRR